MIRRAFRRPGLILKNDSVAYYSSLGDDVVPDRNEYFLDRTKPLWLNLGFWKEARTYPEACTALATLLADAAMLGPDDEILDVGFGFGEQDLLWKKKYRVKRISGLNVTPVQVEVARGRIRENGSENGIDLRLGSATAMPFPDGSSDKVLALECAFHFKTRDTFFAEAFRVLRPARGDRYAALAGTSLQTLVRLLAGQAKGRSSWG